jgi:hypothetical protein
VTKFRAAILFAFSIGLTLTAVAFAHTSDAASTSIPIGIHKGQQGDTVALGTFQVPAGNCRVTVTNNEESERQGTSVSFDGLTLQNVEASYGLVSSGTFVSDGSVTVSAVLGSYLLEDGYTGAISLEGAELDCEQTTTTTIPPTTTTAPPNVPPSVVVVPPTRFTG